MEKSMNTQEPNIAQAKGKTRTPFQYSEMGQRIKKILHTPAGAHLGYILGVNGFNMIVAEHFKFVRFYQGEVLKRGETIRDMEMSDGRVEKGVYRTATKLIPAFNSRVNKGADLAASLLAATSLNSISSPLTPKYIALSTSSLTADKTDTTLTGETAASGLARAAGTIGGYTGPSVLDGACLYTVSKTFTNTSAGSVTVVSAALFDAASSGNLFVEANLSASAILAINDQLAITWTINL